MPFETPMRCPWRCHEIGGAWIAENPSCPFHGQDYCRIDLEKLSQEDGNQMCAEQEVLNEEPFPADEDES